MAKAIGALVSLIFVGVGAGVAFGWGYGLGIVGLLLWIDFFRK